jgi:hypothetical protein
MSDKKNKASKSIVVGIREAAQKIGERLLGGSGGGAKMPTSGKAAEVLAMMEAQKKPRAGQPQGMKLKKGGKVSKNKTRTTKKPRGVGVAQRGYGKALTGKKK